VETVAWNCRSPWRDHAWEAMRGLQGACLDQNIQEVEPIIVLMVVVTTIVSFFTMAMLNL
jgi:hypothetical protein